MGISNRQRITQRDIVPGAIKNRAMPSDLIRLADTEILGPVTLGAGLTLTVTSEATSSKTKNALLGLAPYMITFFQTSMTEATIIPSGSSVTPSDYATYGPFVMAAFTPGGSDNITGDLVIETSIRNTTGGSKTLYVIVGGRYIYGIGGSVSQ